MPLPRRLAKFNLVVTNRVLAPVARHLPAFAVVCHGDEHVIALTYGADSQWVRNVLAAGAVDVETRGRRLRLVDPRVVHDPARSLVPVPVRLPLGLVGVEDFMVLRRAGAAP